MNDGDRESWYRAWTALADRTFAAAESSSARDHRESARCAFLRASNYYRNAYIFHLEAPLPNLVREAYGRHRAAFRRAAAVMIRPPEVLAIPFEDTTLPGYFCAADTARRPLVISVGGYDSTAEESFFWNAAAACARGYHTLIFDGPGQGEMLIQRGVPFRPDWEKVLSAVIDLAVHRQDVDAERIVLIGESWGGYLAPRAAAHDRRVAACVLDPAQIGLRRAMLARLPLPAALKAQLPDGPRWLVRLLCGLLARRARHPAAGWVLRRGMLTHGVPTPWDYFLDAARYEQADIIGDIRCPTLVCHAESDDIAAYSRPFFDALRCPKDYLRFTAAEGAGEHCVSGNRALFHERVFNWLDGRLYPSKAPDTARRSSTENEVTAMRNRTTVERKSERELVVTRTFDAPARVVFEAWTKPELLQRWWAPKSTGVSLHACEADVHVGGRYRFEFGREGSKPMAFFGRYVEVTPHSRLAWTNEESNDGAVTTVTFEEKDGGTLLVMSEVYPSKEALDGAIAGMEGAMPEMFSQLEELLATLGAGVGRS